MRWTFERLVCLVAVPLLAGCGDTSGTGSESTNGGSGGVPVAGVGAGTGGVGGGGNGGNSGGAGGMTSDEAALATDTPYCPGWETRSSAASCLSAAECAAGQSCIFDFTPLPCPPTGAACFIGCTDDESCGPGNLCHHPYSTDNGRCGCGTGGGTCDPPCTDGGTFCQLGYACDPDGRCLPQTCDAGYDCGSGRTCEPGALDADDHGCRVVRCDEPGFGACTDNLDCDPDATSGTGCIRRPCTSASDCDCGACAPNGTGRICAFAVGYCGDPNSWF